MIILGIETSCDDTACAIIQASGQIKNPKFKILANVVSSQIKIHEKFGGIVPSLAARTHWKNIIPVMDQTFKKAKKKFQDINLISVTKGPGLPPSLVSGLNTGRLLSFIFKKPILGINHLEGHIWANFLYEVYEAKPRKHKELKFPALVLIVSGGHTELILMKNHGQYKIIGQTRDDAAGEAFDKTARMLGLGFPGGPEIAKLAKIGDPTAFELPRPMIKSKNYDFSFSGLKTAVLYLLQNLKIKPMSRDINPTPHTIYPNLAASFEQAVVDVLVSKTIRAGLSFKVKTILIGGGVAANQKLRETLKSKIEKELPKTVWLFPEPKLTTDNGAMIAAAGYFNWLKKKKSDDVLKLEPDANLRLE
ncbi:MAG: tRNA (adenosine(37)-N6)-threonylcarbamoyltransferase complex transferase subunit TsaD [Parcubacteria group bacterium]|nr:tRNA (adenosine(37)-N6)-threonylcarbamoyltransferase complex transferase subunit TsaD [Parcubacteria group bacterium]